MGLKGFEFRIQNSPTLNSCKEVNDFFIQFYILLLKKNKTIELHDKFIKKCFLQMDKDFLTLLNLSDEDLESKEVFKNYLLESGIDKTKIENILSIYVAKRKKQGNRQLIEKFIEISQLSLKETKETKIHKKLYQYIRFLREFEEKHPFRFFIELAVSLRSENRDWSVRTVKKIIHTSPYQFALFITRNDFLSDKVFGQLVEAIYKTLELMKKKKIDEKLIRMLATKVSHLLPVKIKDRFISDFEASWSLSELREIIKSSKYTHFAIGFWLNELENRTTEIEVKNFLDKTLRRRSLRSLPREELWILNHFYPGDERRDELEKHFRSVLEKPEGLLDEIIINELLENEAIKKTLSVYDKKYKTALFKLKRESFQKVLKAGYPSEFALYNLFYLGDKDPSLFWWYFL